MIPTGLLPDSSEPRRPRSTLILGLLLFGCLAALISAVIQLNRLARERDEARVVAERLERLLKRPAISPTMTTREGESPAVPSPPPAPPAVPVSTPAPARAPAVRVHADPEAAADYLTRGLQEFRAGRYDSAERQFFRAFPESMLYLALSSLAQRNWRESFGFLARAMKVDPNWLRKVHPRDLFGSDEAYDNLVLALEDQVSKNPIDPDLKTLLAYLRYHDKGPTYAKALLIEATNAKSDHAEARAFLEVLGP